MIRCATSVGIALVDDGGQAGGRLTAHRPNGFGDHAIAPEPRVKCPSSHGWHS
jgi:hypothetical protein